jgi:Aminotransferase class-V
MHTRIDDRSCLRWRIHRQVRTTALTEGAECGAVHGSAEQAAKAVGAGIVGTKRARAVRQKAPEVFKAVKDGKIRLRDGVRLADEDNENDELAGALGEAGVESRAGCHCATLAHRHLGLEPPASCRLSFYLYNTERDVDLAVDALTRIVAR